MELHPILEGDTKPNPNLWYVLSALGDSPSMRVGHTCTFVKGQGGNSKGKVYVIGGANPCGTFGDVYVLDVERLKWDTVDAPGFKARYEHVAFVPELHNDKIYIFGGADQSGNLNDVQVLDLTTNNWSTLAVQGMPPTPRTHHTTAVVGNKLIVYSGGHSGADPVGDRKIHIFDVITAIWSTPSFKGDPPKPRHGHVMLVVGNMVYVHGGMANSTFYDDLHVLDVNKESWSCIKKKKNSPSARAAHGGIVNGTDLYIFGGMNKDGALDDMYKFDTVSNSWSAVKLEGPPPACRLDFGMCVVELEREVVPKDDNSSINGICENTKELLEYALKPDDASSGDNVEKQEIEKQMETMKLAETLEGCHMVDCVARTTLNPENNNGLSTTAEVKSYKLCLIHGGMDTQGEIFDDVLVVLLNE